MITALHQPQTLLTSKNPVPFRLTSTQWNQPNHFLTSTVEITGAAGTRSVSLIEFIFAAAGGQPSAFIDIQRLLDDYLQEIPYPLPQFNESPGRLMDITAGLTCNVSVKHNQTFGLFPVMDPNFLQWPAGGTALCWRGGFSYPNFPELKYAHDWILQYQGYQPFFTWKPQHSLISPAQHEFLAFLNFDLLVKQLRLNYDITYADGTQESGYFQDYLTAKGLIHRVDVGPSQLGLLDLAGERKILFYDVWLSFNESSTSRSHRYLLDYRAYPAIRYLYFVNSLGGLDCVRLVGQGEFTADYKRESATRFTGKYDNRYGFIPSIHARETGGYKLNTGYISRAEVHWLRDLFLSRQVFLLEQERLLPVSIVSKKLSLPEEAEVNALSLELDFCFDNDTFTPSPQPVNYIP